MMMFNQLTAAPAVAQGEDIHADLGIQAAKVARAQEEAAIKEALAEEAHVEEEATAEEVHVVEVEVNHMEEVAAVVTDVVVAFTKTSTDDCDQTEIVVIYLNK